MQVLDILEVVALVAVAHEAVQEVAAVLGADQVVVVLLPEVAIGLVVVTRV